MHKVTSLKSSLFVYFIITVIQIIPVFGETEKIFLPDLLGKYTPDGVYSRTALFDFNTPVSDICSIYIELEGTSQSGSGQTHPPFVEYTRILYGYFQSTLNSSSSTGYWKATTDEFMTGPVDVKESFYWSDYENSEPSWNFLFDGHGNVTVNYLCDYPPICFSVDKFPTCNISAAYLIINTISIPEQYSGGDGSEKNPWKISSKDDLLALREHPENYNDYFVLTNDINMAGDVYTSALIANDEHPHSHDVFRGTPFRGVFNGNGFKIIGLKIDATDSWCSYLGLFGCIYGGQIRNLGIENVLIFSGESYIGGLAGKNIKGKISNCSSFGSISAKYCSYVGGLVGSNIEGNVSNCNSGGEVIGCSEIGGLIGNNQAFLENCNSTCNVSGQGAIGGLVGYNLEIDDTNYTSISNCYSTGFIEGNVNGLYIGGLIGMNSNSEIKNCYSSGDIKGDENVGGLIGSNGAYQAEVVISNCFWNIETQTHGITESIGDNYGTITNVLPLTTAQMQQKSTYTTSPANWDFINIWGIGENQTYPYLKQGLASDLNQDNKVDYLDLAEMANNWLSGIE